MIRVTCALIFPMFFCFGQTKTADNSYTLAIESDRYCTSTATTKPTPQMVIDKVTQACVAIEKEGTQTFSKFKGKGSKFIFAGTYIWIIDLNGKVLMHPIRPNMENQIITGLKDDNGKQFMADVISMAKNRGEGWVDYSWRKPNTEQLFTKLIYIKRSVCNGIPVIVACSVDDITETQTSYAERRHVR